MQIFRTPSGLPVGVTLRQCKNIVLRVNERPPYIHLSVPYGADVAEALRFADSKNAYIRQRLQKVQQQLEEKPNYTLAQRQAFYVLVKLKAAYWSEEMRLRFSTLTLKDMRTRWGSCHHIKRSISISSRLIGYPPECLDYVLVHELAHLRHPNHQPEFWKLVEQYMPDWKRIRAMLR